jgi:type I restriction enzyme S subunit
MRPLDLKFLSNRATKNIERWIIREGMVLVTCSGTIGRTAIVTAAQDGWAASQHILRITPRPGTTDGGFLAAFLSTPYGQHQLDAKVYGGVVDELTSADTADVWVPAVPEPEQRRIGDMIRRVYELRDEANDLEMKAIRQIEEAVDRAQGPPV